MIKIYYLNMLVDEDTNIELRKERVKLMTIKRKDWQMNEKRKKTFSFNICKNINFVCALINIIRIFSELWFIVVAGCHGNFTKKKRYKMH